MTIEEKAKAKAEELGWELLAIRKLSHPEDQHLIYTVCKRTTSWGTDFMTHMFNGCFEQFAYGHYDIPTYVDALDDLNKR